VVLLTTIQADSANCETKESTDQVKVPFIPNTHQSALQVIDKSLILKLHFLAAYFSTYCFRNIGGLQANP